jgi:hypothetical protein
VFDTISEDYTYPIILGSVAGEKLAKISVLHKPNPEFVEQREDVQWLGKCRRRTLPLRVAETDVRRNLHFHGVWTDCQHKG